MTSIHTKEERKKIYLEAAIFFDIPRKERPVIINIGIACGFCDYIRGKKLGVLEDFPEYISKKPTNNPRLYWFDPFDQAKRISVLKACAEECN